jgi:membrane-anchored mycosin MYCP
MSTGGSIAGTARWRRRRTWSVGRAAAALSAAVLTGALVLPLGFAAPAAAAPSDCDKSYDNKLTAVPWPLERLKPERTWPLTRGEGVTVAVVDSGVSTDHPQLANVVRPGKDLIGNTDGTTDCFGHGTVIAGLIAAPKRDGTPFYGLAPGARIVPIRVLADANRVFEAEPTIARGIKAAVDAGADVINLSLTTQDVGVVRDAIAYARSKDVVLVAAAGNEGGTAANGIAYPAAYEGVIAVAGVDQAGQHVQSSSSGPYVDVAAPGSEIEGPAIHGGGYVASKEGGTSYATAYVSATAALIKAYRPDLSAEQVADRIFRTADHPPNGKDNQVGHGVVNPYAAVAAVVQEKQGAGGAAPPTDALPAAQQRTDPLALEKTAAFAITAGVALVAGIAVVIAVVVPRGRRRKWRPTRAVRRDETVHRDGPELPDSVVGDAVAVGSDTPERAGRFR